MASTPPTGETVSVKETTHTSSSSHVMTGDYVILMETSGKECESWYYFIRSEGNEENLRHLQRQLEKVDWYVIEDLSVFDLDLDHPVSAQTAKEMTKVELNSYCYHRKFDGKLEQIQLGFRKKDTNEDMIGKAFDHLSYGQIEDYISDEDIDDEDLTDSETTDDEGDDSTDEEDVEPPPTRAKGIPPALLKDTAPKWAKAKRKHR